MTDIPRALFGILALSFSVVGIIKEKIALCVTGQLLGVIVLFAILVNF